MTNMQARKMAWAFADSASLIKEDRAREELIRQFEYRLHVVEPTILWSPLLQKCLQQCMEERAKEQRKLSPEARATKLEVEKAHEAVREHLAKANV